MNIPQGGKKEDKKILALFLLGFLATATGVGVFLGGQSLLDLAAPADKRLRVGVRGSIADLFFGAGSGPVEKENSAAEDSSGGLPLFDEGGSSPSGSGPASGAQNSGGPGGSGGYARAASAPDMSGISGGLSGLGAASAGGTKSGGSVGGLEAGNKKSDSGLKTLGANETGSSAGQSGEKVLNRLKSVENITRGALSSGSAANSRHLIAAAFGEARQGQKPADSYQGGTVKLDKINTASPLDIKAATPDSLTAPEPDKLSVDKEASKEDPLNKILDALKKSADPTQGVVNSGLGSLTAYSDYSDDSTGSDETVGEQADSRNPSQVTSTAEEWNFQNESYTVDKSPDGSYVVKYPGSGSTGYVNSTGEMQFFIKGNGSTWANDGYFQESHGWSPGYK